jgi:hypothetical protein
MAQEKYLTTLKKALDDMFSADAPDPVATNPDVSEPIPALYESIEDYTAKTGKRFRMTKRQKELGWTREQAFKLTYGAC